MDFFLHLVNYMHLPHTGVWDIGFKESLILNFIYASFCFAMYYGHANMDILSDKPGMCP